VKPDDPPGILEYALAAAIVCIVIVVAVLVAVGRPDRNWDYYQVTHVCHQIDDRTTECHEETWYFKNGERVR
jgi:hypothetical protein